VSLGGRRLRPPANVVDVTEFAMGKTVAIVAIVGSGGAAESRSAEDQPEATDSTAVQRIR
jgi:hypothetical protein